MLIKLKINLLTNVPTVGTFRKRPILCNAPQVTLLVDLAKSHYHTMSQTGVQSIFASQFIPRMSYEPWDQTILFFSHKCSRILALFIGRAITTISLQIAAIRRGKTKFNHGPANRVALIHNGIFQSDLLVYMYRPTQQ